MFSFTFFTAAHFHLAMVAANISHFVTATKFNLIRGHDNISKINTLDNNDTETIFAFRFRLH